MNNARRIEDATYNMHVEISGVRYPVQSSGRLTAEGARLEAAVYIITSGTGEGPGVFAYLASDVESFLDGLTAKGKERADYSADFCAAVDTVETVELAWALAAEDEALLRAGTCDAVLLDARCEGGDTITDYDCGTLTEVEGGKATVRWDSEQTTTQALSAIRAEDSMDGLYEGDDAEGESDDEKTIEIDPSDPFAGLVAPHDQGDVLLGWLREKGAERLAVELLSEASGAGCGTWGDETRRALTKALETYAETIATSVFRLTPKGERDFYAAGYEGNFFATREAAEGGIEALGPSAPRETP